MAYIDFSDLNESDADILPGNNELVRLTNENFTLRKCGKPSEPIDYRGIARAAIAFVEEKRKVRFSLLNF